MTYQQGPSIELCRAYNALIELAVGSNTASRQALEEYQEFYVKAFQAYNHGDLQSAELYARSVRHLCRAAWFDAKVKFLESHSDDLPHLPGCSAAESRDIERKILEIESRLSRLKLMGLSDRFGGRTRKHLQRLENLPDRSLLLAETFMKAAYEYCLATEALHELEFKAVAA